MEKFTVDIDKVLDDFEFNEDRATEIATTSCNNQSNYHPISYESETPVNLYLNNSPHYHYNNSYLPPAYEIKSDELYHGEIETPKLYNNLDDNYLNKNHPAKKNSVSNVFNSLQEYINTDVSTEQHQQQPSKQNNIENEGADQLKQNNLASYGISNIEHQYTLLHKETNKLYEEGEVKLLPKIENNQQESKVDNIYMSNQVQNKPNLKPIDEQLNADNEGFIIHSDCNNINELSDELLPKVDNQLMEQDLETSETAAAANLVEIDTPTDNLQSEYITEIENPQFEELQSLNINYESQQVTSNLEIISELETKVEIESVEKVDIEEVEINSKIPELIQVSCSQNENVVSFDNIEVDDVTENDLDQYLQDVNNEIAQLDLQDGETKPNSEIQTSLPMQEESHEEVNQTIIEEKEQISELTEEISHDASEEINKCCTIPKLSTLCRPNSLDIVSNNSDNEPGPPGETPMPKETDFSPSTSEVSSVENQEYVSNNENEGIVPEEIEDTADVSEYVNHSPLGKRPPYWIPDTDTNLCMHCGFKFTVIRRRHHCRACGLVLCSKCCNMKAKLEYLGDIESRVCSQCYTILAKDVPNNNNPDNLSSDSANNSPTHLPQNNDEPTHPNPNNPMEYCSTVPPLKQPENQRPRTPPTVMVPVGVLKRQGSNKTRTEKTVMFSDGIRPGCDLTELDNSWESRPIRRQNKRVSTPPGPGTKYKKNLPPIDDITVSYIPSKDNCLPPTVSFGKPDNTYTECSNNESVVEMLRNETLVFAIQRNFYVYLKIINLECCVNKQVWCFSTKGLSSVGQDEIIILLEVIEKETKVPKDVFLHLNSIYADASKGNTITEMGFSIENSQNFLDSKNHAGFLYVRPSYQCLQNIILPDAPYLFGILIHRWETPWVKIFPLRLLLRLGAEYRYYPCPIISTRNREAVFVEIGHTIINLLADFRNFSYTLPSVRGLMIHMEEKKTTVLIPRNRYDQVMRALNNSSEHILAFAGNFSSEADNHLVCIQDINGSNENGYATHAINIQNKPRKITGASFIILNGALKTSSGLTAKSSIIEDGLMIHILPDQMVKLRDSLRNMKTFEIRCGCIANAESDEFVNILWVDNDTNFNVGVKSPIDNKPMHGIPSIRVHNGVDHVGNSKFIRWTEVFILQSGEESSKTQDGIDISKLSESISRSTCEALIKYLELLCTYNFTKVGIRVTLHSDQVSYEAGSDGVKLAPIYMNALDNALIPVLHDISSKNPMTGDPVILELMFHILNS